MGTSHEAKTAVRKQVLMTMVHAYIASKDCPQNHMCFRIYIIQYMAAIRMAEKKKFFQNVKSLYRDPRGIPTLEKNGIIYSPVQCIT